jgi:hypothetical protein
MSTELKQTEKLAQIQKQKKQIEGFQNVMEKQIAIEQMAQTTKNRNIDLVQKMREKYDTLVVQYNTTLNNLKNTTMDNINRTTNNSYLNKNIRFSNDVICYVTSEGVAKPYQSYEAFMQNSGKNGCPNATYVDVNIAWQSSYVEGSIIPLTPTLVVGKPMELDQSCGNEGVNIYATKMVSNPTSTYSGCYSDKSVSTSQPVYATYEQCQKYASDNGYKYFGLQDMRSDGKSMCKVYNSPSDYQQYGSVGTTMSALDLWNSGTDSGAPQNTFQLLGTGQMVVKNNNSNVLFSTAPSTHCIQSGTIRIEKATYGENCRGRRSTYRIDTAKDTQKVKQLCDGKENCRIPASNQTFGDPARGCYKSFDVVYRCGNNNPIAAPRVWEHNIANISCQSVEPTNCKFFLIIEDNGKMRVVRGSSIDKIEEEIWSFQPTVGLTPNPEWVATKGKTGLNYLSQGQTLAAGEWIGSNNGAVRLIMEINGNLILQTSVPKAACSVINEKHYGVSPQSNAVYKLDKVGSARDLGKIAYVTGDGEVNEYDDNMLGFYDEYDIQNDYDSYGNNLKQISNVSKDECISQCNADGNCAGFVHQSDGSKCFLKNENTYPRAPKQYFSGSGLTFGMRKKKVLPGTTCKQETVEVDTLQYANYAKGKIIRNKNDCDLNIVSQTYRVQFDVLKNQLSILGEEISTKMEEMYSTNSNVYKDMKMSEAEFKENIKKYRSNINRIRNELDIPVEFKYSDGKEGMTNMKTLSSMLTDADIRLLEENYGYIFWSILAVGVVSTTINIV